MDLTGAVQFGSTLQKFTEDYLKHCANDNCLYICLEVKSATFNDHALTHLKF